jgi:hypothetical protein
VVEEAGGQLTRFERACRLFEAAHAEDPTGAAPRYHAALARFVAALEPEASEPLGLAARCQHLGRHAMPRSAFPEGLAGYKRWRAAAALEHQKKAREILTAAGYDGGVIDRVAELLIKKGLKSDPEVQTFEDAICLTFLEVDFPAFAKKHDDDKIVDIIRKTWAKMTPRGHAAAVELARSLPDDLAALVARAVGQR